MLTNREELVHVGTDRCKEADLCKVDVVNGEMRIARSVHARLRESMALYLHIAWCNGKLHLGSPHSWYPTSRCAHRPFEIEAHVPPVCDTQHIAVGPNASLRQLGLPVFPGVPVRLIDQIRAVVENIWIESQHGFCLACETGPCIRRGQRALCSGEPVGGATVSIEDLLEEGGGPTGSIIPTSMAARLQPLPIWPPELVEERVAVTVDLRLAIISTEPTLSNGVAHAAAGAVCSA
mmetsp:Transcript_15186/g.41624  ORF Transcript_15186/g.41624 Transcript_15186/m.41624 type:complete len:235 (+) Transcript_15186:512-1216(+)